LIDPSGTATSAEKVPRDVPDEETCWRRPPTTEIVAEAEPRFVKQESSDSSKEGHNTPKS